MQHQSQQANEKRDDRALFTVPEAAAKLAISRATLYRLIDRGELKTVRLGRLRRVPGAELCRIVALAQ